MIKWLKARTRQEKWMLALIVVLLIGVILRWGYIKEKASASFNVFKRDKTEEVVGTVNDESADTTGTTGIKITVKPLEEGPHYEL